MSLAYEAEKHVAITAVKRACVATASVFNKLVKNDTQIKNDRSPVTVADYSAQAVINTIISSAFPNDPIMGEEDASDLLRDNSEAGTVLKARISELANEALTGEPGYGDSEQWGIGPKGSKSTKELLEAIDKGNSQGALRGRMWVLDPVDGTKGYLRGEQYAVCLALIVDSKVELGVIGCPNLPTDPSKPDGQKGALFVAVRGHGVEQTTMSGGSPNPLHLPSSIPISEISMLESVEAAHSSHSTQGQIAKMLGITKEPIRMDSQAKYASLARGVGGVYLRLSASATYREKIWDHAAGSLIVQEAGGIVTDRFGRPLEFGLGRYLGDPGLGIVAATRELHPKVLAALQELDSHPAESKSKEASESA